MRLPKFILPALLKLHARAAKTPYFHLPGYMVRNFILGARSPERNEHNPRWGRSGFIKPESSRLYRWTCKKISIRAHTTLRSDKDDHLHDHPAWNISAVLEGGYWEVCEPTQFAKDHPLLYCGALNTIEQGWIKRGTEHEHMFVRMCGIYWRPPGAIVFRKRDTPHKLILPKGAVCKSIFIVGQKQPGWHWGFYTPAGKVDWRTYLGVEKKEAA